MTSWIFITQAPGAMASKNSSLKFWQLSWMTLWTKLRWRVPPFESHPPFCLHCFFCLVHFCFTLGRLHGCFQAAGQFLVWFCKSGSGTTFSLKALTLSVSPKQWRPSTAVPPLFETLLLMAPKVFFSRFEAVTAQFFSYYTGLQCATVLLIELLALLLVPLINWQF